MTYGPYSSDIPVNLKEGFSVCSFYQYSKSFAWLLGKIPNAVKFLNWLTY